MNYPITLVKGGESREVKNSGEEANARTQGFCEPYKFQEYPKALYRNGERVVVSLDSVEKLHDGGCRVVNSKEEEEAARKDGYRMLGDPTPEVKEAVQVAQGEAVSKDDAKAQAKLKKAA